MKNPCVNPPVNLPVNLTIQECNKISKRLNLSFCHAQYLDLILSLPHPIQESQVNLAKKSGLSLTVFMQCRAKFQKLGIVVYEHQKYLRTTSITVSQEIINKVLRGSPEDIKRVLAGDFAS